MAKLEYQAYISLVHHLISNRKRHNYSYCNSELLTVYIIYSVKSIYMCRHEHAMCMEEEKKKQAMFSSNYLYAMSPSPYRKCFACIMGAVAQSPQGDMEPRRGFILVQ